MTLENLAESRACYALMLGQTNRRQECYSACQHPTPSSASLAHLQPASGSMQLPPPHTRWHCWQRARRFHHFAGAPGHGIWERPSPLSLLLPEAPAVLGRPQANCTLALGWALGFDLPCYTQVLLAMSTSPFQKCPGELSAAPRF